MKKIFTLMAAAVMAMTAGAKDYIDQLAITLNGSAPMTSEATITVNPEEGADGTYTIVLNKFSFQGLLIGDVTITGVKGTTTSAAGGYTFFNEVVDQEAAITNGDKIATLLGNKVNVSIKPGSWMNADKMHLVINLPVKIAMLGQDFDVVAVFGDAGYQIPNSDFEAFHTATFTKESIFGGEPTVYTSDEPNAWHSFMSSTGALAAFVSDTPHTFISDDVRPGSEGTKSVMVTSGLVFGFVPANGTITTGQMQAGAMDATSTDNCAFLDFANEDVDDNGDPFYTVMTGTPDAISMWVKFKQGTIKIEEGANPDDYKYATVSAIITDGTRTQDPAPADASTDNIVAKAQNAKIESNGGEWQQIVVPFDYDTYAGNGAQAKAILVTVSTNALPGVGSSDAENPDVLYLDDVELVYNAGLSKLTCNGTDVELEEGKYEYEIEDLSTAEVEPVVEAVSDGRGAYVATDVVPTSTGYKATIYVNSNDMKTSNTYTLAVNKTASGIENIDAEGADNAVEAIYNVNGQRVNELQKGINIVRKADGTTVKVLKK